MPAALRAAIVAVLLVAVTVPCLLVQWVLFRLGHPESRRFPMRYHRLVLFLMGVKVQVRGVLDVPGPLLIVSNHASWLDIPIISSLTPLVFVAKREVSDWPVFGLFARLQRSVFIDRTRKRGAHEANSELAARLKGGEVAVLFAEGTSSDGNRVLPFKSSVIGAAEHLLRQQHMEDVHVQPLAIAYTGIHGLPMGRRLRADFSWYGDIELMPHIWDVLKRGPFEVVVSVGPVHALSDYGDRKTLTRALESEVRRMFLGALTGRAA